MVLSDGASQMREKQSFIAMKQVFVMQRRDEILLFLSVRVSRASPLLCPLPSPPSVNLASSLLCTVLSSPEHSCSNGRCRVCCSGLGNMLAQTPLAHNFRVYQIC